MKLENKLILIFAAITVVNGMLIGYCAVDYSTKIITLNRKKEMSNILEKIDLNVQSKVSYLNQLARSTKTNAIVRDNINDKAGLLEKGRAKRTIDSYFGNLIGSFDAVANIMIIDRENTLYSCLDYYTIKEFNLTSSPYYAQAEASNGRESWMGMQKNLVHEYQSLSSERVLTLVSPVFDYYNTYIAGVLIISMEPETFHDLLVNSDKSFTAMNTFMLDQKNELICSNMRETDGNLIDLVISQSARSGDSFDLSYQGEPYLVSIKTNALSNWKIVSMVPYDDILSQSNRLRELVLSILMASTIAMCLLISLISHRITKPILEMTEATFDIRNGNFAFNPTVVRNDEIGKLTVSFKTMVDRIDQLISEVYKQKILQKNAEFAALQAQINPHFLYNTLDTINWMLIDRGEDEISALVIAMGDMMKYCVDTRESIVTVGREVENIRNYLLIQKARMEDRLVFSIDIPPSVLDRPIPKLILQPLVENAIVHGLEPCSRQGRLLITASVSGDRVAIVISDNGAGIAEETLLNIFTERDRTDGHRHIGLHNVDQRLKLKYGEESGLDISSKPGSGTEVRVIIVESQG